MSGPSFQFGDHVRHVKRPEWGVGAVLKAELISTNGHAVQRLNIRFPNAGLKTLSTDVAQLEVIAPRAELAPDEATSSIVEIDRMGESDWLAPTAQKKVEEVMISLPPNSRDAFSSITSRLKSTLKLYRFEDSGRGLIDWAIAQSRLDDPLSRFNRHELERLYDRWTHERDEHLVRLLQEAKRESVPTRELLKAAPPIAPRAIERLAALR